MMGWLREAMMQPLLLVGLGSALGGMMRYTIGRAVDQRVQWFGLPWGTFTINVSGSFLLAVLAVIVLDRLPPTHRGLYLLLGTGFCGGFTTFSTFEWETFRLASDGGWWQALVNVAGSCTAGFAGILLGVLLVNLVFGRA